MWFKKIKILIGLIYLLGGNIDSFIFSQSFIGGNGGGYSGSTIVNTDLNAVPEVFSVEISLATGQSSLTNNSAINFAVVFNKATTDFVSSDVTLSGTAGATNLVLTGSGTDYIVEVSGMSGEGTVIISILQGVCCDADGNLNPPSINTNNVVTYDNSSPGIEIVKETGQKDPTNDNIISFVAHFTEPVSGFVPSYVNLSGTAGASDVDLKGGPLDYTLDVSGMTNDGTVTVSIDAGQFADAAGNMNTQSVNTDNTVTFDNTKPEVTLSSSENSPTNSIQIAVTIEFSSVVIGFEENAINITNASIIDFTEQVAGTRWQTLIEASSEGTINIQVPADAVEDLSGNTNNVSNQFQIEYIRGNSAPLVENQSFMMKSGSETGTLVGRVTASDPDGDGMHFTIASGNTDDAFELDPDNGDLLVANSYALNFYDNPVFNLTIQVTEDYTESLSSQAEIEIIVSELDKFEASNIFTPNSFTNRFWTIRHVELYHDFELTIRNSIGQIVYHTKNYLNDWNGTYNNKPLPTGTYYYFLTNAANGKIFKGFINIIYE